MVLTHARANSGQLANNLCELEEFCVFVCVSRARVCVCVCLCVCVCVCVGGGGGLVKILFTAGGGGVNGKDPRNIFINNYGKNLRIPQQRQTTSLMKDE